MTIDEILKLATAPSVTTLCVIVWIELRAIRKAMTERDSRIERILIMALTGKLNSWEDFQESEKKRRAA